MINNHVPSYETCLKLKEAGFPQECIFYWEETDLIAYPYVETEKTAIAAPLLSEILEEITKIGFKGNLTYGHDGKWVTEDLVTEKYLTHQNVAESASLLWLKLNEKGKKDA